MKQVNMPLPKKIVQTLTEPLRNKKTCKSDIWGSSLQSLHRVRVVRGNVNVTALKEKHIISLLACEFELIHHIVFSNMTYIE